MLSNHRLITCTLFFITYVTNINSFSLNSLVLNRRDFFQKSASASAFSMVPSVFNQDKPICIIGASGETGIECIKILSERNKKVRAVSRKGVEGNKNVENIQYDIRNATGLDNIIRGTSSVIFLANGKKKPQFSRKYIESSQTYEEIDVSALTNVVKSCVKNNIKRFVYVSASCKSCMIDPDTAVDKISGIECENCRSKQTGEGIIRDIYSSVHSSGKKIDYTIIRVGFLINGDKRKINEIEINQDFTKSGMLSREDLATLCIDAIDIPKAGGKTVEAYYKDTTQPFDVKESLDKCTGLGKSIEECFFGSEYKDKKPTDMEEVRKKPIKGSLFATGNEYLGEELIEMFEKTKSDSENNFLITKERKKDLLENFDSSDIMSI